MANKQETVGNLAISDRQQRVIVIEATEKPQDLKLRVEAYTRVSSDSAAQRNSFAAQNRHYTELISSKETWVMVDIYAALGITGTSAEKRDDFQRLMADCRRGDDDRHLRIYGAGGEHIYLPELPLRCADADEKWNLYRISNPVWI